MRDLQTYKSGLPKCYYGNVKKCIDNQFSYLGGNEELCIDLLGRVQNYIDKKLETKQFTKKKTKTRHG